MTRRPRKAPTEPPPRRATIPLPVPTGAVAKEDEEGNLAGFYRPDQRAGRPASQTPLEAHLHKLSTDYTKQQMENERTVAKAIGAPDPLRAAAGRASGRSTKRQAKKQLIRDKAAHVQPGRSTVGKIARAVGVTPKHVRATLKNKRT